MINISLIAAAGVLALFGWGWLGKIFHFPPRQSDTVKTEQRLETEGVVKADGTVSVDKDFDAELNAQIKELNAVDQDTDAQLKP